MAKEPPMPHYERLLAAASNHAGRYFLGHCVTVEGRTARVVAMWTSKQEIEPALLCFMRRIFGTAGKEEPRRPRKK